MNECEEKGYCVVVVCNVCKKIQRKLKSLNDYMGR